MNKLSYICKNIKFISITVLRKKAKPQKKQADKKVTQRAMVMNEKMTFLKAAIIVLEMNENLPMTAEEIWDKIIEKELYESDGKTPIGSLSFLLTINSKNCDYELIDGKYQGHKKKDILEIVSDTPRTYMLCDENNEQYVKPVIEVFSKQIYAEWKKNKNSKVFEEAIEQMMLDKHFHEQYAPFIDEIRSVIKLKIAPHKKRFAILSILDDNRNLLKKAKIHSNYGISKLDHIKDLTNILRKYVKVSEVEKKKFGEVMTPLELVAEMLRTLPKEVWSNPDLKWLDPCNGSGPFLSMVILGLMKGLKNWEPDENKRYNHILKNMVYACELQPKNMFLYMMGICPYGENDLNIYCGSFLDAGFDNHMKEVWGIEKFDIILGNPPYNEEFSASGTAKDLFDKFVLKSINLSDKLLMITPSRWFSKGNLKGFRDKMLEGKLQFIKHFDNASKVFPNTEITGGVSYFLHDASISVDVIDFNGTQVNLKEQVKLFGSILYEQNDLPLSQSIISKIKSKCKTLDNFIAQGYFGVKTNGIKNAGENICYFSDQKGTTLKMLSKNGRYYSYIEEYKDNRNLIKQWKVMTSSAYGANPKGLGRIDIIEPGEICSESFIFFNFDTEMECINFKKYLETNFSKFLIALRKNKQHVTSKVFELVPKLDFTKEWDDVQLFKHFNLSNEEKKLIA